MVSVEPHEPYRQIVPLDDGLPEAFSATVDDPELPYLVQLEVDFRGDRVECTSITCQRRSSGTHVTSEGMTKVRIAELLYRASLEAVHRMDTARLSDGARKRLGTDSASALVAYRPDDVVLPERMPRGGPDREHVRAVARVYLVAYACGGTPRKAVMNHFGLARTTAHRWISRAREAGLIPSRIRED